jgi:hypothetical protein
MRRMRKAFLAFSMLALLSSCANVRKVNYSNYERRERLTIHEKVCEVIDREEMSKYWLFKGIKGYQEAVFYGMSGGGGYVVEIFTDEGVFESVNMDIVAVHIIHDYIENFDKVREDRRWFEEKWKIIDYDVLGFAITEYEIGKFDPPVARFIGGAGCLLCGCIPVGIISLLAGGVNTEDLTFENESCAMGTCVLGNAAILTTGVLIGNARTKGRIIFLIQDARRPRRKG